MHIVESHTYMEAVVGGVHMFKFRHVKIAADFNCCSHPEQTDQVEVKGKQGGSCQSDQSWEFKSVCGKEKVRVWYSSIWSRTFLLVGLRQAEWWAWYQGLANTRYVSNYLSLLLGCTKFLKKCQRPLKLTNIKTHHGHNNSLTGGWARDGQ